MSAAVPQDAQAMHLEGLGVLGFWGLGLRGTKLQTPNFSEDEKDKDAAKAVLVFRLLSAGVSYLC